MAPPCTSSTPPPCTSLSSECGDSGLASASLESQYYARVTIIDDCGEDSVAEGSSGEEGRGLYHRSISEPPGEAQAAASPLRKLSECEGRADRLTGLFFQRLLAAGEDVRRRSSSSLASQDSGRSEGRGGLRKFESRASLDQSDEAPPSPATAAKFGSSFTINKHKKVDLDSFEPPGGAPKRREARFSQGEERPAAEFETGAIKKAASVAAVDASPRCRSRCPLARSPPAARTDPSLLAGQFEGRHLVSLVAAGFAEDSYLRVALTGQDLCFIGRHLGALLLGLGVLRCTGGNHDPVFKVITCSAAHLLTCSPAHLLTLSPSHADYRRHLWDRHTCYNISACCN